MGSFDRSTVQIVLDQHGEGRHPESDETQARVDRLAHLIVAKLQDIDEVFRREFVVAIPNTSDPRGIHRLAVFVFSGRKSELDITVVKTAVTI